MPPGPKVAQQTPRRPVYLAYPQAAKVTPAQPYTALCFGSLALILGTRLVLQSAEMKLFLEFRYIFLLQFQPHSWTR